MGLQEQPTELYMSIAMIIWKVNAVEFIHPFLKTNLFKDMIRSFTFKEIL